MKLFALSGDCAANGMTNSTSVVETDESQVIELINRFLEVNRSMSTDENSDKFQRCLRGEWTPEEKADYAAKSKEWTRLITELGWHKYMGRTTWIWQDDAEN